MSVSNPHFPSPGAGPSSGQNDVSGTPLTPPDTYQGASAEMMTRVVRGAHDTIDQVAERALPPLQQLEHGLSEAGNVLQDKAEQWRMTGDEWAEGLRDTVREHPLVAVAAALAVGVVISRLAR